MREVSFHDFYAPIDGTARRFCLCCHNGQPKMVAAQTPLAEEIGRVRAKALYQQIELINHLLKSLPWAALATTQRAGNIGAVIEAAEARRLEIYGRQSDGEQAA